MTATKKVTRRSGMKVIPAAEAVEMIADRNGRIAEVEARVASYSTICGTNEREITALINQRDYLIGVVNRLLDRFAGVHLLHGIATIDQMSPFIANERAAFQAEMTAIRTRNQPQPEAGEDR